MPTFVAKQLCKDLVVIPNNFEKYKIASDYFMEILRQYDPELESLGSDEGRLDLTDYMEEHGIAPTREDVMKLMSEIRQKVHDKIKVTASCGCAPNKLLAKLCSEVNKPNGQFFLERTSEANLGFLENMKIRKIPGIGPQCEYILNGLGIDTVRDLRGQLFNLYLVLRDTWFVNLARRALGISNIYHNGV